MELKILSLTNTESGKVKLPVQFNEVVRPDLIKRAVEVIQANKRQSYGADPRAGMKASAELSRRRKKYRGSYGAGISRVQRKIMSSRGTRFNWVGAVVPGTVGGRRAHPPKAEKIWSKDINKKERRKAIRSALSATLNKELVENRGHVVPDNYPFIIEDKFELLDKTKQVSDTLKKLGFVEELKRTAQKSIRAGRGTTRGRKYKRRKGILVVVSDDCKLSKAARNIPGIDVARIQDINVEILAPGAVPGRLTIFTNKSLQKLDEEKLFI